MRRHTPVAAERVSAGDARSAELRDLPGSRARSVRTNLLNSWSDTCRSACSKPDTRLARGAAVRTLEASSANGVRRARFGRGCRPVLPTSAFEVDRVAICRRSSLLTRATFVPQQRASPEWTAAVAPEVCVLDARSACARNARAREVKSRSVRAEPESPRPYFGPRPRSCHAR
jgi:hypothetical protein